MPNDATASPERETASGTIPRRWLTLPLALALGLLAMESTGIDRAVSHWFYDRATHAFPWRDTFLLETLLHQWGKYMLVLATSVVIAAWLLTWVIPPWSRWRPTLLFLALAMTLAPLAVSLLKHLTDRPCPWNVADFGGFEAYTHLFEFRGINHARARCFPAGDAAAGFTLLAFYFALHRLGCHGWRRTALLTGMLGGMVMGIGRIAQGAHFLSHVLWAGLVCWLVMVGLYAVLFTVRPDSAPTPGPEYNQLF